MASLSGFLLVVLALCISGDHALDSLRFFIIGDIGGLAIEPYSTYYERTIAEEMGQMANLYSPQFVLELGDNFYVKGVQDVQDMRFNRTFEFVFSAQSLQIPWYIVAGNHDHYGNVTAQILYSNYSKRWNFPSLYYYKEFLVGGGSQRVGIVFIDTILLCGKSEDHSKEPLRGPENRQAAADQWSFIQQHLKMSRADYLFTAGHYPIYSTAWHGPTQCLVQHLQPMLDAYQATGHLAGHEHNLQHLRVKSRTGENIDYIISGMGTSVDPTNIHEKSVPPTSSLFHYGDLLSKGGFVYAEATNNNITFIFINGSGKQLYSTTVFPRKKK